jgi:hypothetical protein
MKVNCVTCNKECVIVDDSITNHKGKHYPVCNDCVISTISKCQNISIDDATKLYNE